MKTTLCEHAGIEIPLICGAMYPCSNPELVAAVSESGGIGIVQPLSLVFVHKYDFREGLRYIKSLTDKPVGLNLIVEKSVKAYEQRSREWLDIALEEGIRFFVTALGNPHWVVEKAHAQGGVVYHDVTSRKWAERALKNGVDGLICVNRRAGGHAGEKTPQDLMKELSDLNVPLICAGGIGEPADFKDALTMGYAGCQLGTRFIATEECKVHEDYKDAIVKADAQDIVLTEKISGVPVAVIETPYIKKTGTKSNWFARKMLQHRKLKHTMRTIYSVISIWKLRGSALQGGSYKDYWQAGKSVAGVKSVRSAKDVVREFADAL